MVLRAFFLLPLLPNINQPLTVDLQVLLSFSNSFYRSSHNIQTSRSTLANTKTPGQIKKHKTHSRSPAGRRSRACRPAPELLSCLYRWATGHRVLSVVYHMVPITTLVSDTPAPVSAISTMQFTFTSHTRLIDKVQVQVRPYVDSFLHQRVK